MATQNRWQATQMRQQVMDYYNDQIMENLIRTKEHLPFVHVDVTSLTSTDAATLTGTVGAGETPSFARTSRGSTPTATGFASAVHTIARGVTRPFSYSITPTRNTSVQILASPVLGTLPANGQTTSKTTNKVETTGPDPKDPTKSVKTTTEEETQSSKSKPETIYTVYEEFVRKYDQDSVKKDQDKGFCHAKTVSSQDYVPGTKKRWGDEYYYIRNEEKFKMEYYKFCKKLFTKGPSSSVLGAVQAQANAAVEASFR
jgi:hypothetical protein